MSKATWQTILALLRVAVKVPVPILLALVATISIVVLTKDCGGPNKKYWMLVAEHEAAMKAERESYAKVVAEDAAIKKENEALESDNLTKTQEIARLKKQSASAAGKISDLESENAKLLTDAQAAIDANPALQLLVRNFTLQIEGHKEYERTLELRLAKVGEPVEMENPDGSVDVFYPKDTVTGNLWSLVANERHRADIWVEAAGRKDALIKSSESLRLKAESRAASAGFIAKVEAAVIIGAAAYVGGRWVGNKLNLW